MSEGPERLLALIQEEKDAFVRAEYGRLQSVMGSGYTERGEPRVFHPLLDDDGEGTPARPEELSLVELAMLPHLEREIPRLGTLSTMPLFRTSPYEARRLRLLADIQEKLLIGRPCTPDEERSLLEGHEDYLRSKRDDDVVVIK